MINKTEAQFIIGFISGMLSIGLFLSRSPVNHILFALNFGLLYIIWLTYLIKKGVIK